MLIIQRRLPHYRVAFFEALRAELSMHGIDLRLAHGIPDATERSKNDGGALPWAEKLATRYFLGRRLCWQPFGHLLAGVQLVIVAPENKLVYNLWPQFFKRSVRFAFWGHGGNLQGKATSAREGFKRLWSAHADWWFAYTAKSVRLIERTGFPASRTTVLNNAVDTTSLFRMRRSITADEQQRLRAVLGLQGAHVGVFVGSLYAEKRIDFMLDAARRVRERIPDFEFLIIGAGPQSHMAEAFCSAHPWAHLLGVRTGADKVAAVSMAQIMLNPGAVGLSMLDSFACGVPLLTTDCDLHGPEIEYLTNGENGVMTINAVDAFVEAVTALLTSPSQLQRMASMCEASSRAFTLESMVRSFADGVVRCLDAPIRRGREPA